MAVPHNVIKGRADVFVLSVMILPAHCLPNTCTQYNSPLLARFRYRATPISVCSLYSRMFCGAAAESIHDAERFLQLS